jgi:E3 ubiquitin-protein ligase MARCH6
MHHFRPVKTLLKVVGYVLRILAAHLRLSSYLFGPFSQDVPATDRPWPFSARDSATEDTDINYVRDGTFKRVPATDNIALSKDMPAVVELDRYGEPADDESRALIAAQDAEAEKAKRDPFYDYTPVYIPPHFWRRLIACIFVLWSLAAAGLGVVLSAPILLGRATFRLVLEREVHDGYSFILGFYLLWGCYTFGKAIDRMDKRRQRRGGDGPRTDLLIYATKRSILWSLKISYMIISMGIVIPILIAIVMELYLLLPIRYVLNPHVTPRLRIVDMWCLGILYTKVAIHAVQLRPPSRVTSGLQTVS